MDSRLRKKRLLYGFLVAPIFMAAFFGYSAYLGRSNPLLIEEFCIEQRCECVVWNRERIGVYQIENNIWNSENVKSFQQCVFMSDGENNITAGWAWNWPGIRFGVVAYPNILYGKNPWLPSTSAELPIRIDKVGCLKTEFDVVQMGSGKNNLSFDLWITNSPSSDPSTISHEIMIWLTSDGFWPAGSGVDTLIIDGNEIELWKKDNHNPLGDYEWTFLALVYQSDFTEGSINIHEILEYLVKKEYIESDAYLSGIQFGNEIVSGYGKSYINNFEISFCDK
ncbi:MAG: GH12 family glycosyl hydrolase domain-containing protein [Nitrospinales bacterium]